MSDQKTKAVPANTTDTPKDQAPPAVPSNPSADTRGAASTATTEGLGRPSKQLPHEDHDIADHRPSGARSEGEVAPPGERVDDESDGKVMKRQE